jgi:nucleotide-binding universal stress UspA family protein
MREFRRILHPTDFSPASRRAFQTAVSLAKRGRGQLLLLHVVAPPAVVLEDSFMTARTYLDMEKAATREAQERLGTLRARAAKAGARVKTAVARGVAFEEIVRAARRSRADVIVIGTHGRTGLRRVLLGSVAERVVGRAACPVLSVRGDSVR